MLRIRELVLPAMILLYLVSVFGKGASTLAARLAQETPLKQNGEAYEINPDNQGILWVSDW